MTYDPRFDDYEVDDLMHQPITEAIRTAIARRPQRQDSLQDQLKDLSVIAEHCGMYDAADAVKELTRLRHTCDHTPRDKGSS